MALAQWHLLVVAQMPWWVLLKVLAPSSMLQAYRPQIRRVLPCQGAHPPPIPTPQKFFWVLLSFSESPNASCSPRPLGRLGPFPAALGLLARPWHSVS